MYKGVKFSATPIDSNVVNQIMYIKTHGNTSRHVDKCCTASLVNSSLVSAAALLLWREFESDQINALRAIMLSRK